jgi:hypothetical protein
VPAPDLSGPTAKIESLMVDANGDPVIAVRVTRDREAEGDDSFDTETGDWTRPVGDSTVVYEGKALVRVQTRSALEASSEQGYQPDSVALWAVTLPLGSDIAAGDIVEIITSTRNQYLVGRTAVVTTVVGSSFSVGSKATAVERIPVPFGRGDQA